MDQKRKNSRPSGSATRAKGRTQRPEAHRSASASMEVESASPAGSPATAKARQEGKMLASLRWTIALGAFGLILAVLYSQLSAPSLLKVPSSFLGSRQVEFTDPKAFRRQRLLQSSGDSSTTPASEDSTSTETPSGDSSSTTETPSTEASPSDESSAAESSSDPTTDSSPMVKEDEGLEYVSLNVTIPEVLFVHTDQNGTLWLNYTTDDYDLKLYQYYEGDVHFTFEDKTSTPTTYMFDGDGSMFVIPTLSVNALTGQLISTTIAAEDLDDTTANPSSGFFAKFTSKKTETGSGSDDIMGVFELPLLELYLEIEATIRPCSQDLYNATSGVDNEAVSSNTFNYDLHGQDWPDRYPTCAKEQQSPINLLTPKTKYGQSYEIFDIEDDNLVQEYWDLENILIEFNKAMYSVEVYIDHSNGYSGFSSTLGKTLFGAQTQWDSFEFIFHRASEHTLNGERMDLELQVYHTIHKVTADDGLGFTRRRNLASLNNNNQQHTQVNYAAVAILFSVEDYDDNISQEDIDTIDSFFDNLKFEEDSPIVEKVALGKFMHMIDWGERWIYKGSMTVPPCDQFVYWNVIKRTYPIKQYHVTQFINKLNQVGVNTDDLNGNWRQISKGLNRDVFYVISSAKKLASGLVVMAAGLAVVASSLL